MSVLAEKGERKREREALAVGWLSIMAKEGCQQRL